MKIFAPKRSTEIILYHQSKICVNEFNILCRTAESGRRQQGGALSHRSIAILQTSVTDFIEPSN